MLSPGLVLLLPVLSMGWIQCTNSESEQSAGGPGDRSFELASSPRESTPSINLPEYYFGPRTGLLLFIDGSVDGDEARNVAHWDGGHLKLRDGASQVPGKYGAAIRFTGGRGAGGDHPQIYLHRGDRYIYALVQPEGAGSLIQRWDNQPSAREYRLHFTGSEWRFEWVSANGRHALAVRGQAGQRQLVELIHRDEGHPRWELCVDGRCETSDGPDIQPMSIWRTTRFGEGFTGIIDELAVGYVIPTDEDRAFIVNDGAGRPLAEWSGPILPTTSPEARVMYHYLQQNTEETLRLPEGAIRVTVPNDPDVRATIYMRTVRGPLRIPNTAWELYTLEHMEQHRDPARILVPDYARMNTYTYGMRVSQLTSLSFPGIDNPFADDEALCRRSSAKVFPYVMVVDYGGEVNLYYSLATPHFASGYLEQLGELYFECHEAWPDEVRDAVRSMGQRWIRHLTRVGPQDVNTNMDAKAMEGASWFVAAGAGLDDDVEALLRKYLFGAPDGTLETWNHDIATWSPSGIPLEADGPSVNYGGRWVDHTVKARLNLGPDPRWAFLDTVLVRTAHLIASWVAFDLDGEVMGDGATGNRVAGTWLKDLQQWDPQVMLGFTALYCKPEFDFVGCRIGLRMYKRDNRIMWDSPRGQAASILQLNGYSAPAGSGTSTRELRTGSPWPEATGVELKGFVGEHGGWADIVNEVAAKGDHRSWAYAHPRAETPDQVRLFSREHPVFRFRRGTGPDGRRFSYMLEHFSAFGRANVPSYGEFGGGKVAMMAIDDMGPIIVSDRFEHTRGWWEKENREHWPLEDFWIRWADGGESYFSHGDKVMDDAEVTVRDDGIDYAYEWNESISIRKSFRDLADGIEVTLHFSYAGDEDVQEATYRIPLVDKGTLLEYTSGSEWVDVTTDYSPPVARLRLTRNGRHAYIDFDTPRRVRWTGRKFHDRIRNRVTPIHILLNDGGPLDELSLTYRIRTRLQ